MADDEKQITGAGGPEAAVPQDQPPNVVTDNSGEVPVQPVATSDPTINDNTNPKVFFDGSDPRNIPPHDSNEQLHIAAEKRIGAELGSLEDAGDKRREAVEAAYDNAKDVRDVIGDESSDGNTGAAREAVQAAQKRAQAQRGNQATPPSGRAPRGPAKSTTQA
jgi:hypothetical protein